MNEIPYSYPGVTPTGDVVNEFAEKLDVSEESGKVVTVAGRVMLLRVQGKLAFATLRDWSGDSAIAASELDATPFVEAAL